MLPLYPAYIGRIPGTGLKSIYCPNFVAQSSAPCRRLYRPANGWIRGTDFRHGKRITFGCNGGYQIVGSSSVTCDDGRWRGDIPVCKGGIRSLGHLRGGGGGIFTVYVLQSYWARKCSKRGFSQYRKRTKIPKWMCGATMRPTSQG